MAEIATLKNNNELFLNSEFYHFNLHKIKNSSLMKMVISTRP